ncbi:MAG: cbb3-type cytochrome oxidase assembly protein [Holophaga sp.]|nr:cbb3-type cytochrome oxidase assembly protein [Holophaga sp.]
MEMTWISIAASLAMGLAAAFLFIFAVKRGWFKDIEDAKYQVFWSDRKDSTDSTREAVDGSQSEKK